MKFWQQKPKTRVSARQHKIKIVRVCRMRVPGGNVETIESTSGDYWASYETLSATMRNKFLTLSVIATDRFTVDAAIEIFEGDRIILNGREFLVKTVTQENRRDKVIIAQQTKTDGDAKYANG